ncbi:hypothetical protein KPH14_010174 [Odynerus spinipes]|uniref:Uncharacterized protein n=1 Tax=Odynerus spinipes TaxID=1348599 RepID=A0AAD9RT97_9HYME|nr:hypothetical protein KPH14_010174 [Odynerus spinipes]
MIATKVVFLFVFLFTASRCYATPIRASIFEPIIAVPTFLEEGYKNLDVLPVEEVQEQEEAEEAEEAAEAAEEEEEEDVFIPSVLLILGGYLNDPENSFSGKALIDSGPARRIEKRHVPEQHPSDDLQTAAGTNVLRPLFVYRQQLAYRQRLRDAIRRGNRL